MSRIPTAATSPQALDGYLGLSGALGQPTILTADSEGDFACAKAWAASLAI
jgi:hypothetical protein